MNKPDYFGREYYLVAGLRVRLEDNSGALLPWFVPIESIAQVPVADAVFQVVNQISQEYTSLHPINRRAMVLLNA
eukprot:5491431-Amphidinium_carterae.1